MIRKLLSLGICHFVLQGFKVIKALSLSRLVPFFSIGVTSIDTIFVFFDVYIFYVSIKCYLFFLTNFFSISIRLRSIGICKYMLFMGKL